MLLHISNRYLDLDSVLGATIKVRAGRVWPASSPTTRPTAAMRSRPRRWRCSPRASEALEPFRALEGVSELDDGGLKPWTDDYSDILGPFLSKRAIKPAASE